MRDRILGEADKLVSMIRAIQEELSSDSRVVTIIENPAVSLWHDLSCFISLSYAPIHRLDL